MWRTAIASGLFLALAYASVTWLTLDFQVWTAEGARRLELVRQAVPAPRITVAGPHLTLQPLSTLLADGRVSIVDFIYTRCDSVCSALGTGFQQLQTQIARDNAGVREHATADAELGSDLAQLQRQTALDNSRVRNNVGAGNHAAAGGGSERSSLRLLSLSFDPAHDDTQALKAYATKLGADPRLWQFAAPSAADVAALLDRYGVVVIPDGLGGYQHNAALLVVDGRGRLQRIFDYGQLEEALVYATELATKEPGT